MSLNSSQLDTGIIIRRSLFFLILIILTLGNLFAIFRGINSPQGMEQAQIAREIARGNGFSTKMIRPMAYKQASDYQERDVPLVNFQDTYHSPLNPLLNAAVFKLIGADAPQLTITPSEQVYPLDRVVAIVSTLFFLMSIGVSYLLVSRIFDAKIAGVTAILMLFCETFWGFSLSGLPQMLMLLLFSCGIYFAYRATEATADGKISMMPAIIAGVFFTLLALTHWMTVWIALGYIIYAAIVFRPRGIIAVSVILMLILAALFPIITNVRITGSPFGAAYLTLYNGLGNGSESLVMRGTEMGSLQLDGLMSKILRTTLLQATDIIPLLAGIIVAPLFFISLLHPFKRASIANFRWAILLMWVCTAFGLAFFGVTSEGLDPNQLHLLFAPIMTAYGLAFLSILWSRLEVVASTPMLRNVHHFVVVGICILPLALSLPMKIRMGIQFRDDKRTSAWWPPYFPPLLADTTTGMNAWVPSNRVVFSDQPWAVAWYADRMSIWLPPTSVGFELLETAATNLQTPVSGIMISPSSHGMGSVAEIRQNYQDFSSLVLDGNVNLVTLPVRSGSQFPNGVSLFDKTQRIEGIMRRYRHRKMMLGLDMVYYGDRQISAENQGGN